MLLILVATGKFNQTTDKFSVPEVVAVVKIEENFIPTLHLLEVDVVVERDGLLINTHGHLSAIDLDVLCASLKILAETLGVPDAHFFTIDA